MKYKSVIFDLDGTILDTLDDLYMSVNFALNNNNLPLRTKKEIRDFVGNGIKLLIDRAVPPYTEKQISDKVFSDFKEHYAVHSNDNTKPYEGINNLIQTLKIKGIKTAVVSNKADFAVQKLIELYFKEEFDFVLGEKEGIRKKPDPDMVIEAMSFLNASQEDCVYVGDSEVDIQTALNSGIDSVIVNWGFRDNDFLLKNGAEITVGSVEELLNFLI